MVKKLTYSMPDCEYSVCNRLYYVLCQSVGVADSSFTDLDLVTGEVE